MSRRYTNEWNCDEAEQGELERESLSICMNQPCRHPYCPEDSGEIDPWDGTEEELG